MSQNTNWEELISHTLINFIEQSHLFKADDISHLKQLTCNDSSSATLLLLHLKHLVQSLTSIVRDLETNSSASVHLNNSYFEMRQKIDEFIKSKRRKVNVLNRKEFCHIEGEENPDGCARTCSVVKKLENNKSHIKVERVYNEIGPQNTRLNHKKEMQNHELEKNTLLERIDNMESQLLIFSDKRSSYQIYERIQDLENRIVKLEEINPDYRVLLKEECSHCLYNRKRNFRDKQELLKEIDERINTLKEKISTD